MIRKLKSGEYRLCSRRRTPRPAAEELGDVLHAGAAEQHEREVQYFKRH